jgi:nucleotide-binding universal stress UspA family protein
VQKVLLSGPDLVIKAVGGDGVAGGGPGLNDWNLARTCPVPLLFMGPQPWRSTPRIAASVDPTDQETPGFARQIVESAARFAASCGGELDLVFGRGATPTGGARDESGAALQALADEFGVPGARVHTLSGEPAKVLPPFVVRQHYDLIALGALTHRQGVTGLVGTLTDALMQVGACDFLLLKPGKYSRTASLAPQPSQTVA